MIIEEEQKEKDNNINEIKDISANELYSKLDEWNNNIISEMEKTNNKKQYHKLKDMMIKFNKMPTPLDNVDLIDIKLGARLTEDEVFLEQDFIAQYLRRGESLFFNNINGKYDYARIGLNKFFDYKKIFDINKENDVKLQKRVLGNMIKISNENENNKNVKYYAYLTTKVNGENFQVSYNTEYQCWVIASKNVSIAVKKKSDIDFYKNGNNFLNLEKEEDKEKDASLNPKEIMKKNKKAKKEEKKKKKQERIERRKKEKENDEIKEEEEKEEKNDNKIINNEKEKDKKNNKAQSILNRFSYACDFAETWFNILEERIIKNNLYDEFIKEISDHTLIGESVGDKKREHILVYKERDIIFYGIVNNKKLLTENCIPLSQSFNIFKKYNLTYTEIQPSEKFDTLNDLLSYINTQYDVIFDKSLQESGEGNVVYFSCDINNVESIQNCGKLKTFDYRFLRKIREKCKGVPPPIDKTLVEKELEKKKNSNKNKKKNKKNKDENEEESEKDKEKMNKKIDNEMKQQNQLRDKKIENLIKKIRNESAELLKEVPNSKYNTDKVLREKYFNFAEYVIKYKSMDNTAYNDVFASYIEIMKQKFEQKAEINELMINEIKKKFEGLININNTGEDNEEEGNDEEDQKEEKEEPKEE